MKILCSQPDCYGEIDTQLDVVKMRDGSDYPLSLKCEDCLTDAERKTLKNYRKRLRQKANKAKRLPV